MIPKIYYFAVLGVSIAISIKPMISDKCQFELDVFSFFIIGTVNLVELKDCPCVIIIQDGIRVALWLFKLNGLNKICEISVITQGPSPYEANVHLK